jgi:hypothetical protein
MRYPSRVADDPKLAAEGDPQALTSLRAGQDVPADVIATEAIPVLQGTRTAAGAGTLTREARPLQSGQKGKATVRVRYPVDRFESGVEGVDAITADGVEVGPSKVDDLLAAARSADVTLEVID